VHIGRVDFDVAALADNAAEAELPVPELDNPHLDEAVAQHFDKAKLAERPVAAVQPLA
jgi:hypothetical protein